MTTMPTPVRVLDPGGANTRVVLFGVGGNGRILPPAARPPPLWPEGGAVGVLGSPSPRPPRPRRARAGPRGATC